MNMEFALYKPAQSFIKKHIKSFTFLATFTMASLSQGSELQILSATVKDKVLAGVTATLQKNGQTSLVASSDDRGRVRLDTSLFGDTQDSLLILSKEGYSNLVIKCPCDGLTYAMSTKMQSLDGLRVVLNWGASPSDLDSHIVYPGNHIYFSKKKGKNANLDVDDTNSYGPETITIEEKAFGERYVYAVHNYSDKNQSHSKTLSNSQARVMVYVGETLMKTYMAKPNTEGTLWVLFGIDEGGDFQDIDQYTYSKSSALVGNYLNEVRGLANMATPMNTTAENIARAKKLNTKGEKVYHQKNYSQAIALFQQSIELWGNYGQAYSNLGLSFQKAGRTAEAIWANRKAIALADGKNKKRVQASSYYNIARIYESQNKWLKAKQHFELALSKREHSAYTKGINRMNEKVGS